MNKLLATFLLVPMLGAGCSSVVTSDTAVVPTKPAVTAPTIAVGEPNPATPVEPVSDMRTFARADLGFNFQYPAKFGDVNFTMSDSPDMGKIFRGTFTKATIEFGGATKNFEAGREGSFLDFGMFYGEPNRSITDWAEANEYGKTIPVKGSIVYLLTGKDNGGSFDSFGPGEIGALVKLNSKEFPGVAFTANTKTVSVAEFEKMMSTIEVK